MAQGLGCGELHSGRVARAEPARSTQDSRAVAALSSDTDVASFVLFGNGAPASGWTDASWSTRLDPHSSVVLHDGQPTLEVTSQAGWSAFGLADWNARNTVDGSRYTHVRFWIHGGLSGGQALGLMLYPGGQGDPRVPIATYLPTGAVEANTWRQVVIPLDDLGATGQPISHLALQDISGKVQPPYYIDGLEFIRASVQHPPTAIAQAQVSVDASSHRRPISPLIYGMAHAEERIASDANITLNRLGGNPFSRYNWTLGNAVNAGSDWEFRNFGQTREPDDARLEQPSGLADQFFLANQRAGAATLLTVPMLDWVANGRDTNVRSLNPPSRGGSPTIPGADAIPGYDPATNQRATSVRSYASKGGPFQDPPDTTAPAVYQDEWISHLVHSFGSASDGGVRFYAIDNEPDLWSDNTHVDVRPARLGYDELLQRYRSYATAVKAVDPTAQITGPVVSGWTGLWYSGLDRGTDNFHTAADRGAHGGMPLIPWFLDQMHQADQASGQRLLDVLDVHWYPQGGEYSTRTDPAMAGLRLRSTRSLWDPTYVDESWIARTSDSNVQLIPRLQQWIDQYYPGTRLGITEWNWGAETSMNGALAIAEVLGIYGREGVYLANYWTRPPLDSPGEQAFKMYRNYDGQQSGFGDTSVEAHASNPDQVSVFASDDSQHNQIKLLVINMTPDTEQHLQITVTGVPGQGAASVYQLSDASGKRVTRLADTAPDESGIACSLPPSSVTLLVIPYAAA